jgi:WD40 repeat protein
MTGRRRARLGVLDLDPVSVAWVHDIVRDNNGNPQIRAMALSDDGQHIATAGSDARSAWLHVVDVRKREGRRIVTPLDSILFADVSFSADGKTVYAGGSMGYLYEFDVATGTLKTKWLAAEGAAPEYGHRISRVATSPDGRLVAAGTGSEGDVYLWAISGGCNAIRLATADGTITGMAFSPDSKLLATSGVNATSIKIWRVDKLAFQHSGSTDQWR